jgi:hypothetical protein
VSEHRVFGDGFRAPDSPRFCEWCESFGEHHTDRCPERAKAEREEKGKAIEQTVAQMPPWKARLILARVIAGVGLTIIGALLIGVSLYFLIRSLITGIGGLVGEGDDDTTVECFRWMIAAVVAWGLAEASMKLSEWLVPDFVKEQMRR